MVKTVDGLFLSTWACPKCAKDYTQIDEACPKCAEHEKVKVELAKMCVELMRECKILVGGSRASNFQALLTKEDFLSEARRRAEKK
jgi:predicted amidophosphoribosyltransferase